MKKFLFIFIFISSLSYAGLNDDLIIHWAFENNLEDSSGNNNNITIMENNTKFTIGKIGNGLHLLNGAGINAFIPADYNKNRDITNFTISLWLKRQNLKNRFLIYRDECFSLSADTYNSGEFEFKCHDTNNSLCQVSTSNHLAENTEWHYLTATHDGTTIKLYVDGIEQSSSIPPNWTGTLARASNDLIFWTCIDDIVDEVRIYNRVLNKEEISTLYLKNNSQTQVMLINLQKIITLLLGFYL